MTVDKDLHGDKCELMDRWIWNQVPSVAPSEEDVAPHKYMIPSQLPLPAQAALMETVVKMKRPRRYYFF